MSFTSGSVTFRRLLVVQPAARGGRLVDVDKSPTEELLEKLRKYLFETVPFGTQADIEYGWSGGRHIEDVQLSFEHNVFGDCLLFALRVDVNKAPAELKRAYQAIEEEALAAANPSGFISKAQKKEARESAKAKIEDELRDGRHRKSKLVPVLWDLAGGVVYTPGRGKSIDMLCEIFERSTGAELQPVTYGSTALRALDRQGRRRDYEDLKPTRFVLGPEGEGQFPEYPWVAKGSEPKEFLGSEFFVWLWREAAENKGVVGFDDGPDVSVLFDRSIDLDCVFGQTGRDTLRGDGPTTTPEFREALRFGKVPTKAGLILEAGGEQFALTLSATELTVTGAKLPEIEADNIRELVELRIDHLRTLAGTIDRLYSAFLVLRASPSWTGWAAETRLAIDTAKAGKAVA